MEIRKRNGESVPFQQEKVFNAMKKAFDGQESEIGSRELNEILTAVLDNLAAAAPLTVERVQDEVERTLMERGHYGITLQSAGLRKEKSIVISMAKKSTTPFHLSLVRDAERTRASTIHWISM